jgi:glycosyltransferase involved in cell wall biosynthesis
MLCHRPAIATAVGGVGELVTDGVTGFLIEAPTADSVADGLERAWKDRHRLQSMGITAGDRVRRHVPEDPASDLLNELLAASKKV